MPIGVLRGVPWAAVAAATGAAALLLVVSAAWPDRPFSAFLLGLALAALASAACFVLDEPAAEAVDAAPVSLRRRSVIRATALSVPFGVGVLATVSRELRFAETTAWGTVLLVLGLLVVSATAAAALRQRGFATPGELAATAMSALVLLLVLKEPVGKWVAILPLGPDPHWDRTVTLWSLILAGSLVVLASATRDPLVVGRRK